MKAALIQIAITLGTIGMLVVLAGLALMHRAKADAEPLQHTGGGLMLGRTCERLRAGLDSGSGRPRNLRSCSEAALLRPRPTALSALELCVSIHAAATMQYLPRPSSARTCPTFLPKKLDFCKDFAMRKRPKPTAHRVGNLTVVCRDGKPFDDSALIEALKAARPASAA